MQCCFSQYLSMPVSLFLYFLYFSSLVIDLFLKNCPYSRFFFLQACFNELVIHGLSGRLLMIFCLTIGHVVLYIFVNFSVNVLYITLTSSLFSILFHLVSLSCCRLCCCASYVCIPLFRSWANDHLYNLLSAHSVYSIGWL